MRLSTGTLAFAAILVASLRLSPPALSMQNQPGSTIRSGVAQRTLPPSRLRERARQSRPAFVISEAGRFRVRMPAKPEETTEEMGRGIKQHTFAVSHSVDGITAVFHVSYLDLPDTGRRTPQESLKAFHAGYRKESQVREDREIALGQDRGAAREYRLVTAQGAAVRERLILDGKRLYILYVATLPTDARFLDSEAADDFFWSFVITRQDSQPASSRP